jgi:hypothetical protein
MVAETHAEQKKIVWCKPPPNTHKLNTTRKLGAAAREIDWQALFYEKSILMV